MDWVVSRSGLDTDSIMNEGCVRMRGLPFGCTEEMVSSFFSGMKSTLGYLFSVYLHAYRNMNDSDLFASCISSCYSSREGRYNPDYH